MTQVIIILGCRTHGGRPSRTLAMRMERALAMEADSEAYFLVTGGIDPGETVSEAAVMADCLAAGGIPAQRIIREDTARSTYANFAASAALLDARLGPGRWEGVFVTSGYHVPRCRYILRDLPLPLRPVSAPSPRDTRIRDVIREGCVFVKYLLFGYRPLPFLGNRQ